jgi:glycosyltransferase involved in cell wall biosynthesis
MRIVIDLQGAQCDSRFRGIGRYSLSLALAMARNAGKHDVWLALNSAFPQSILELRQTFDGLLDPAHIRVFNNSGHTAEVEPTNAWRVRTSERMREHFLEQLKPDVIHIPTLFEGYGDDAVTSVGSYTSGHKTAVTIHDLIPLMDQANYLPNPAIRDFYFRKIESLKRTGLLLAISESSRLEAIEHLSWSPEKIINTSEGADAHFKQISLSDERKLQLRTQYGIARKMVMYAPGGFDPRKNFDGLMQAYALLPPQIRAEYQLVLASRLSKSPHDDSRAKMTACRIQAGLAEDELVLTDFLPDDDLVALYNMADLFVFPSKHEGFGLPPLEAMACGAPTLGANASSLPEVIGWSEALFDPHSPADMAEKMTQALVDDAFRAKLKAHGIEQVKKFSWDASALKAIAAFEGLHARNASKPHIAFPTGTLIESIAQIQSNPSATEKDLAHTANAIAFNTSLETSRKLLVDVTELVRFDAKSGIQRVVRSILIALHQETPHGYELCPIYFDGFRYLHAKSFMARLTQQSKKVQRASFDEVAEFNQDDIYLGLDLNPGLTVKLESTYQHWLALGLQVYFVVYDILLVDRPDWAPEEAAVGLKKWLTAVSQVSTGLLCISEAVANDVRTWLQNNHPKRHRLPSISSFHLGADVESSAPSQGLPHDAAQTLKLLQSKTSFLTVGTLEPRKGQQQTLAAFELLWHQQVDVNLVIVGKKGWMVDDLAHQLNNHAELGKRLFWLDGISDEYLEKIYKASGCLVSASEGEGFGLPLIEAAKQGIPILARDLPVFREVAGNHAFYFTGLSAEDLALAVKDWLSLHLSLNQNKQVPDSTLIPILTWAESAAQLVKKLPLKIDRNII